MKNPERDMVVVGCMVGGGILVIAALVKGIYFMFTGHLP